MKKFLVFFSLTGSCNFHEPKLDGAFENVVLANSSPSTKADTSIHNITIFRNSYWIGTSSIGGSVLKCSGGTYKLVNGKCVLTFKFHSEDTTVIGKSDTFSYNFKDNKYLIEGFFKNDHYRKYDKEEEYNKITTSEPLKNSFLEGVWQMKSGQGGLTRNFDEATKIYAYPCFTLTFYNSKQKQFFVTHSGIYQFDGVNSTETILHTSSDLSVGTISEWEVKKLSENEIQMRDIDSFYNEEIWERVE